ncbi:NepR family anti-sigma factor [Leisingera sp.]|uniref:NepR family anti-sigma factor n=1 Tax=Leisingera sp. TaxID=1879318 RepID=UPI002B27B363|nr:NepR family anti-sigma factor [Leisingera sp.]
MAKLEHNHQAPLTADRIDRNLKKAFHELATEPLPDRFSDLLDQLRKADLQKKDMR